jgi:hypothetical protein
MTLLSEATLRMTASPEDLVLRAEIVARAGRDLSEEERRILRLRFGFDCRALTLEETGALLRKSGERIRQIEARAIRKMHRRAALQNLLPKRSCEERKIVIRLEPTASHPPAVFMSIIVHGTRRPDDEKTFEACRSATATAMRTDPWPTGRSISYLARTCFGRKLLPDGILMDAAIVEARKTYFAPRIHLLSIEWK